MKNERKEIIKTIEISPKIGIYPNSNKSQFTEYNKQKLIIHHNNTEDGICLTSRQNSSQNFLLPYTMAPKPLPKLNINSNSKKNHFTEINRSCLKRYGSVDIENYNPNCVKNIIKEEEVEKGNLNDNLKKPKRDKKITIENIKYPKVRYN